MLKEIEEAIIQMANKLAPIEAMETGTPIDELTGIYGLPRGYITEFWGESNTGKSTAAIQAVVSAQRQGLRCLWVNTEEKLDTKYLEKLGVDLSKLGVMEGLTSESILNKLLDEVKAGNWDVVVLDSIGSLSSRIWFEKEVGDRTMGVQASILTRFVQVGVSYLKWRKIVFIGINHTRVDIATGKLYQMGGKFWAEKRILSIRFREKTGVVLKSGDKTIGKVIILKVLKNHAGPTEGKEMEVQLIHGEGFSVGANLLQKALDLGVIRKEGNTHFLGSEKLGTIGKVRELLKEEEFVDKLKSALS